MYAITCEYNTLFSGKSSGYTNTKQFKTRLFQKTKKIGHVWQTCHLKNSTMLP